MTDTHPLDKPDISKPNVCPPLPDNANGLDKLVYWLAIGLGSGLPKKAPGTWGTVGGMLVGIVLMMLGFVPFLIITIIASVMGIWICDRAAKLMGVHDDPHIVWDEWAGIWIGMLPIVAFETHHTISALASLVNIPNVWVMLIVSFILFRFFDILKPFPIGYLDKKLEGGLGIMLDDILAGLVSAIIIFMIL